MHNPSISFYQNFVYTTVHKRKVYALVVVVVQLEASSNEVKGGQRTKKSFVCLSMHAAPCIIGCLAGWLGLPWRGILSEIVKRRSNKIPP